MPNLSEKLEQGLSPQAVSILQSLGRMAFQHKTPLFLVGGSVRDLLLGLSVRDLDLVIEGDAAQFSDEANKTLHGRLMYYHQFGTVTMQLENYRLDIATARRETYLTPGALPRVRPGRINEDLGRRDFTINSMAIALLPEDYGELFDLHQGQSDLENGLIRVLHPQSFSDDPTRIFRAVRYEQRLRFRLHRQTQDLMQQALIGGGLDTVSGDRLRAELSHILEEPRPYLALLRAARLGIFRALYPALGRLSKLERVIESQGDHPAPKNSIVFLCLMTMHLEEDEVNGLIRRLNMSNRWAQVVRDTVALSSQQTRLLERDLSPSDICEFLDPLKVEAVQAVSMVAVNPPIKERLSKYLGYWREVRPCIDGYDLLQMGIPKGPAVGEILRKLRSALLDSIIVTPDEQKSYVEDLLDGLNPEQ